MGLGRSAPADPAPKAPVEPDPCWLCLSRHGRDHPSAQKCDHCSCPLCSDCLNNHTEEQLESSTGLSQQFHAVKQRLEEKQNMIDQETSSSTEQIEQCFETYQNDLLETCQTIIDGIRNEKQNAEHYLDIVNMELQTIADDIKNFMRESVFLPNRAEDLSTQLTRIQDKLETYQVTKDIQLEVIMPKYTLRFECIPTITTDTNAVPSAPPMNLQNGLKQKTNHRQRVHPYNNKPDKSRRNTTSSDNNDTD